MYFRSKYMFACFLCLSLRGPNTMVSIEDKSLEKCTSLSNFSDLNGFYQFFLIFLDFFYFCFHDIFPDFPDFS